MAVITASPSITGGDKAHESLLLTLGMLDVTIVQNGLVLIPSVGTKFNNDATVTDEQSKTLFLSFMVYCKNYMIDLSRINWQ